MSILSLFGNTLSVEIYCIWYLRCLSVEIDHFEAFPKEYVAPPYGVVSVLGGCWVSWTYIFLFLQVGNFLFLFWASPTAQGTTWHFGFNLGHTHAKHIFSPLSYLPGFQVSKILNIFCKPFFFCCFFSDLWDYSYMNAKHFFFHLGVGVGFKAYSWPFTQGSLLEA